MRNHIGKAILCVFIIAATLFAGYHWGETKAETISIPVDLSGVYNPDASTTDFSIFWKAWNLLQQNYVPASGSGSTTDQDRVYGAIEGLAASYGDPYTEFFPPAENQDFQTEIQGNFDGVGMEVDLKNGALTVIAPLKGSPAEQAGIEAGDVILKINDMPTDNMTVDQAVDLIRGPQGTTVKLNIQHNQNSAPVDITITRENINLPTIDAENLPNNIFMIKLYTFTSDSGDLFRNAMRQFQESGDKKLIVDLRGDPGGYLDQAVDIASWFLPVGDTVVTEDFGGKSPNISDKSKGYDIVTPADKVVVLVDGGSASASEILAGALHDYNVATLVGETTFGKGSVQELIPITDDTSLKVTVARWLTPKGISISEKGITPDVIVPVTDEEAQNNQDPQLAKAEQLLSQ